MLSSTSRIRILAYLLAKLLSLKSEAKSNTEEPVTESTFKSSVCILRNRQILQERC